MSHITSFFRFISFCCFSFWLIGCASNDVQMSYYQTEQAVRLAEAEALKAKYTAMSEISKHGNDTVKAVALMSIDRKDTPVSFSNNIRPPENPSDTALKWLSVLAPIGLEGFRTFKNSQVQMHSSDNALTGTMFSTQSSENTNLGLARLINPTPVITPNPVIVYQPTPLVVKPEVVAPVIVK